MELLLNTLWLLLALASFAYCQPFDRRRERGRWRKKFSRSTVALVCALALLFPVISLTDDLHGESAVAEDSSTLRVTLKGFAGNQSSSQAGKLAAHTARADLSNLLSVPRQIAGRVAHASAQLATAPSVSPPESRAPPSSLRRPL